MFVLIIVIHYYTYMVRMITVYKLIIKNILIIKNNEHCCAYILCILPKFHHITDLLMNLQWLPVYQRILLEVLVLTYNLSGIFSIP